MKHSTTDPTLRSMRGSPCPLRRKPWLVCLLGLLPLLVFVISVGIFQVHQAQQDKLRSDHTVHQARFGYYLYESFDVTELLSERGEAEGYYYHLVHSTAPQAPYFLIRYRVQEAERVEALLQALPQRLSGRIDLFYTEDYEYIKRYFQWPALESGYPASLEERFYYVLNLSDFEPDRRLQQGLLVLISLLLACLPLFIAWWLRGEAAQPHPPRL